MRCLKILRPFKNSSYQFFMQWFADACEDVGIEGVDNVNLPWKLRLVAAKCRLSRQMTCLNKGKEVLVVPCGGYPDSFCFPFGYNHDIVPVMWDTWPRYHKRIVASFRRHRVRVAFFTQGDVANKIQEAIPEVKCHWIPEGVDTAQYDAGRVLEERHVDLLELGRLHECFHSAVTPLGGGGGNYSVDPRMAYFSKILQPCDRALPVQR